MTRALEIAKADGAKLARAEMHAFGWRIDPRTETPEVERLRRMFLECWHCKAALIEPESPPHCDDCGISDDELHEWDAWRTTDEKGGST